MRTWDPTSYPLQFLIEQIKDVENRTTGELSTAAPAEEAPVAKAGKGGAKKQQAKGKRTRGGAVKEEAPSAKPTEPELTQTQVSMTLYWPPCKLEEGKMSLTHCPLYSGFFLSSRQT